MSSLIKMTPRDGQWLNKVMIQLKILSRIQKNDKVNTCGITFSLVSGYYGTVFRCIHGENRKMNLQHIYTFLNTIKQYIEEVDQSDDDKKSILRAMSDALVGVNNLGYTYTSDVILQAEIECMYNEFTTYIEKMMTDQQ